MEQFIQPVYWELWQLGSIANPDSVKDGSEISFTRYFCRLQPLYVPEEIWTDLRALGREFEGLLGKIRTGARPHTAKRTG